MGVGKTTIAKELARQLNMPCIDTDKEIEKFERKSITKIFNTYGEDYFRDIETRILRRIRKNHVVSCGGGTVLFNNNMKYIQSKGKSIYLQASTKILFNRLKKDKKNRPIINTMNEEELNRFIIESISKRKEIYEKATYKINIDNKTRTQILRDINALISPF